MEHTQKLSNSFLVYSAVILSILIYIFGVFAVIHFVTEAGQSGFIDALAQNAISATLGIICLFLAAPIYRFTKSLRMVDLTDHKNGPSILTLYSPYFISDMPQADSQITIQNLKDVNQHNYFSRLVELRIEENGTVRIIKSFMSPRTLKRLKNT